MSTEEDNTRPNIRIQIKNTTSENSEERMDVDEEDNEEGEITDDNEKEENPNVEPMKQVTGIFTTGINIFDKKEQEKLQERARRFALKPEEINSFSDQDMRDLYESLGINDTNENEIKFKVVHLVGLDQMSAEDVVDYFANYAPEGIEWIDENSCNIVWLDNLSAARGLHFKSKVVRGMPARHPKDIFPKEFLDDVVDPEQETGQSILIKNKNREVELQNEIGEVLLPKKKSYPKNSVDISEITIPVPPGYWRLGNSHPNSKCLLMRYGVISDKLPFKSEKCNKYYKKLANPGQKNVISETKKKELRSLFERNRELNQNKNPWGALAKNWDKDAKFREREPVYKVTEEEDFPAVEIKNPKLLARLGAKRKRTSESEEQKPEEQEEENDDIGGGTLERKKTKMPRMKMYADEEEENAKRRKIIQTIKKQAEKIDKKESEGDLRDMLGHTNRLVNKKDQSEAERNIDLGIRLKNRSQKMIFAIERDLFDRGDHHDQKPLREKTDARTHLEEKNRLRYNERDRAPLISRSVMLRKREKRTSPEIRRRSVERYGRSSRRRTPERTLRSDQMVSKRSSNLRKRSHSRERKYGHKTRSKVAVVIKTPQKPTVASTIWSKVKKSSESEYSSSESNSEESENSSSSSESESESDESDDDDSSTDSSIKPARNPDRPGFDKSRLAPKNEHHSPLKITMTNEHYNKRKK